MSIEEKDMYSSIRECGSRIFDVHLGENNRLSPGDGSIDWRRFISTLHDVGYDGGLAHEAMPPIDRTSANLHYSLSGKFESGPAGIDDRSLQFLKTCFRIAGGKLLLLNARQNRRDHFASAPILLN